MWRSRSLIVILGLVVALTGCASRAAQSSGASPSSQQVTVSTATGEVTVPVTTEGIWALDEFAALQLLALGVRPIGVGEFFGDAASKSVLAEAGIALAKPSDVEVVAAASPRLIVGINHPSHTEIQAPLEKVAKVVLPDFTRPWTDQLKVLATVTGRDERGAAVIGRVEQSITELAADLQASELAGASVSLLGEYSDGSLFAFDQTTLAGRLVERLGLTRPAGQVNEDNSDFGFAELSEERLPDHGADVILSYVEAAEGSPSVLKRPIFAQQVKAAKITADVPNGIWSNITPLSAWWMVQDLRAVLLEGKAPADLSQTTQRWRSLTDGLG